MAEGLFGGDIQVFPGNDGGQRQDASAQALADDHDVRNHPEVFEGEHAAGAAQRMRDLVEDEQGPVAVAGPADGLPILGRGDGGSAADRLGNHRGNVTLLLQDVLHVAGAGEVAAAAAGAAEDAAVLVRRWRMFRAGHERAHALAEDRLAADRDGVEGGAVEGIPHGNRLVPAGGDPRQLQRDADRLGAPGAEEGLLQGIGRDLGQLLRQVHGHAVGVAARAEGQLVELAFDRVNHRGIGKADLVHVVAVEVHVAPALQVLDGDTPAGAQGVEARGGKGLPQEIAGILRQKGAAVGIQVLFLPGVAPR